MTSRVGRAGSPSPRRTAFTIPEVLVASLLMMTVFGLVMLLWINATRGVTKGEDALAAIQDASLVVLNLRKDLQNLALPAPEDGPPFALRYIRIRGSQLTMNVLTWDPVERGLLNDQSTSDSPGDVFKEDKTELSFYVRSPDDGAWRRLTYAYLPERRSIRRELEGERPRLFALPRMKDFFLQLEYASEGGLSRALLGAETPSTGRMLQLWFSVRFVVQSEQDAVKIQRTKVEMDTRLFPRYANRQLHARWVGSP